MLLTYILKNDYMKETLIKKKLTLFHLGNSNLSLNIKVFILFFCDYNFENRHIMASFASAFSGRWFDLQWRRSRLYPADESE